MLATECWNGFITFWDVPNRKPIGQPLPVGSVNGVSKVAFSPDGKILASGDRNDKIILWNVASRQPIGKPLLPTSDSLGVVGIAYNPSGTILISAYTFGPIVLWNVNTHQIIRQLSTHDFASFIPVQDLAVSQDGREVAARDAGTVVLWDATTGQSIGQPLGHPNGSEYSYGEDLAFSPDGRALAFGGCNQWDANGHCLEGKITIIDLDPQSLIERTCKRAGRNFTKDEWDQYFPGEPYQLTCPEWPANIQVTPTSTPTALP
jgi:WD40 repeat protein